MLSADDIYLFREGTHSSLYREMGCQLLAGDEGAHFAVWAPNAQEVSVIGDWNAWQPHADALSPRWDGSGIWEGRVAAVRRGASYKYRVTSKLSGRVADKADPFAFYAEVPPARASRAWSLEYAWNDSAWMRNAGAAMRSMRRCRSMRCILARGGGATISACCLTGRLRTRSLNTLRPWASPT